MYVCLCACGPACRSVGLPVSLSNCRSVWLSACLYNCVSVCWSVAPSVGRSPRRSVCLRLSVGLYVCQRACLSVCRYVCLSVELSGCLPACMPILLCVCLLVCRPVGLSVCRSVGRGPSACRSSLIAPSTQAIFACVLACRPVGLSLAPSHSDSPSGDTRRGHATTAPQVPSATREAAASTGIPTACLAAGAVASVIPSC